MSNVADVEICCTICGVLYSDACEHISNNNKVIDGNLYGTPLIERALKGEISVNGVIIGHGNADIETEEAYNNRVSRDHRAIRREAVPSAIDPSFNERYRRNGETIDNATYYATTNREFSVIGTQELRNREEIGRINREMLGPIFDSRYRRNGETLEECRNRISAATHYSGLPHNLLPLEDIRVSADLIVPEELSELSNEMIADIQERFLNEEDIASNIVQEKLPVKVHISKVTDRINRLLDQKDD
jgi:hypothetical protein